MTFISANIHRWVDALVANVQHGTEKLLIEYDPRDLWRTFLG
jgi:hypothetical protein